MTRVNAVNTAPDSENRIHDDSVAAKYGVRGGLVPGVTVYGYMTVPVLEHFGERWLEHGAMSVRLKAPVFDGEKVSIEAKTVDGGRLEVSLDGGRATGVAWLHDLPDPQTNHETRPMPEAGRRPPASHETLAVGTVLGTLIKSIDLEEARVSAPLPAAVGTDRAAHPSILLALSNELLMSNVLLGPWIHASSEVTNFSKVCHAESVTVHGRVIENFERKGHHLVVLDVLIRAGQRTVQTVRHTAIWKLRD